MIPWHDYDLLLFDFDDTLVDFSAAEDAAISSVCLAYGRTPSPTLIERFKIINRAVWSRHEDGKLERAAVFTERFRQFLAEIREEDAPENANKIFLKALAGHALVYPTVPALLAALQKMRKVVGIVSNGHGPTQRARATLANISPFVAFAAISDEIGVSKPDRLIFEAAYRMSGLGPGRRVLMIGDSFAADVLGALAAGFDACWISHGRALDESYSGPRPTFTANSSSDLVMPGP